MRYFLVLSLLFLTTLSCTKKPASDKISGTVSVSPELAASLKPTDVLYIIARSQQIGPPSAVKRVEKPQFPLTYTIGPEDAMMAGAGGFEPDSNMTIAVRISRTGNAIGTAGDLEGVYLKNPARPGQSGADVVIDRIRK